MKCKLDTPTHTRKWLKLGKEETEMEINSLEVAVVGMRTQDLLK